MLRYCAGAVGWLLGCGPPQSEAYLAAAAALPPDELAAVRRQYPRAAGAHHADGLDQRQLMDWCGLATAPPALADGLFSAVSRCAYDGAGSGDDSSRGGGSSSSGRGGGDPSGRGGGGGGGGLVRRVSLEDVIVAKSRCERMDDESATEFAFAVLDAHGRGAVSRERLAAVLEALLALSLPPGLEAAALVESAAAIAAGATTAADPLPATAPAAALDLDAFRRWCSLVPAPKALLTRLLARVGSSAADEGGVRAAGAGGARDAGRAQHAAAPSSATPGAPHTPAEPPLPLELPRIVAQAAATPAAAAAPDAAAPVSSNAPPQLPRGCLLRPEWVWLLAPGLAPAMRREWRLLFSSAKHGASFSTLLGRLGGAAPTLLLVRDHGGRVFGGVAHAPWRRAGAFYGDYANKLVSLLPQARIYPASGINANLQWCGVAFEQLPNGVGFGGQIGNFGLWLDSSLDTGHSRPNATYASPSLSIEQSFRVDAVEAWLLQPDEEEEAAEEARRAAAAKGRGRAGASILSQARAQEDQRLLELAGVAKNYRGAIPDEPLEEG